MVWVEGCCVMCNNIDVMMMMKKRVWLVRYVLLLLENNVKSNTPQRDPNGPLEVERSCSLQNEDPKNVTLPGKKNEDILVQS